MTCLKKGKINFVLAFTLSLNLSAISFANPPDQPNTSQTTPSHPSHPSHISRTHMSRAERTGNYLYEHKERIAIGAATAKLVYDGYGAHQTYKEERSKGSSRVKSLSHILTKPGKSARNSVVSAYKVMKETQSEKVIEASTEGFHPRVKAAAASMGRRFPRSGSVLVKTLVIGSAATAVFIAPWEIYSGATLPIRSAAVCERIHNHFHSLEEHVSHFSRIAKMVDLTESLEHNKHTKLVADVIKGKGKRALTGAALSQLSDPSSQTSSHLHAVGSESTADLARRVIYSNMYDIAERTQDYPGVAP